VECLSDGMRVAAFNCVDVRFVRPPADLVVARRRHGGVVGSDSEGFVRELGGVIVKFRTGGYVPYTGQ
jgi:hypothetical protein